MLTFDPIIFRQQFPAYGSEILYPDADLQIWWDTATLYITNANSCSMADDRLRRAISLMMAHLLRLQGIIDATGNAGTSGMVSAATIDKVNVTVTLPPSKDAWGYWLSLTPYGQQLQAFLLLMGVGGLFIGGLPETAPFLRVGGARSPQVWM